MKHFILWSTRFLVLCCAIFIFGTISEINAALKSSPKVAGVAIPSVDTTAMASTVHLKNPMRAEAKTALAQW